jgi:hypothetical protein
MARLEKRPRQVKSGFFYFSLVIRDVGCQAESSNETVRLLISDGNACETGVVNLLWAIMERCPMHNAV